MLASHKRHTGKLVTIASSIAAIMIVWFAVIRRNPEPNLDAQPQSPVQNAAHTHLSIPVETTNSPFTDRGIGFRVIRGNVPTTQAALSARSLLSRELSLYPPDVLAAAKISRIVLCANLEHDGVKCSAIHEPTTNTFYIDAAPDARWLSETIHHEFFHVLEERVTWSRGLFLGWCGLNPPGFAYQDPKSYGGRQFPGERTRGLHGFVSKYATTSEQEDRAETFSVMVVNPAFLSSLCETDAVLSAKARTIKTVLKEQYPSLSDRFWQRVEEFAR